MTTLQDLLGVNLPIIQAPMAGVQDSRLALAVSNAGGLGSLPCAMLTADAIRKEVAAIRAGTDKPFNVNFFCHALPTVSVEREARWHAALAPYYAEFGVDVNAVSTGPARAPFSQEIADSLEECKPPVVSFHFGLPSAQLLGRVKAWGARILSSATTRRGSTLVGSERRRCDYRAGLGAAGGHRGMFLSTDLTTQTGTFALVPQIVRAVHVPLGAAGRHRPLDWS
jgi:nitronate monooxygenase